MAKPPTPLQSLVLLILGALAVAGWLYGIHWKRVAEGDLFTSDEKLMIRLQDQIQSLTRENEALHHRLGALTGESASEASPAPNNPPDAGIAPAPVLPGPPQKIETH